MAPRNHYETLDVSPTATQAEIKQAYRRLVKQFHPDSHLATADPEQIRRVNAAYEILGDPHHRRAYDLQLQRCTELSWVTRHNRAAAVQNQHRQAVQNQDEQLQQWLKQVYVPTNHWLSRILNALEAEIDDLSADPFDDELMASFQIYLDVCKQNLHQAHHSFRSIPNPSSVAGVAAHLYYCLNQTADGLEELERFTLNFDDYHLHVGQELFRIADGLRQEAREALHHLL
jgi:molecular chaperone DnaJ